MTEPNELIEPIHNRMRVVLDPEDQPIWLTADHGKAQAVAEPYGGGDMEVYDVSPSVNDPSNDRPAVISPLALTERTAQENRSPVGEIGDR